MKISSYNITDISYHYIGLRVIAGLPSGVHREEQIDTISRNILKYESDRALRYMLPEPRGTFGTVGEKVCQELVHFEFARSIRGAYELTDMGRYALDLVNKKRHVELRRLMVSVHLQTYDNLRIIIQKHLEVGAIWRPIVDATRLDDESYFQKLLEPTFGIETPSVVKEIFASLPGRSSKKIEDLLQEQILRRILPGENVGVALFRSMCDRLVTLRLLNIRKISQESCDFLKNYSPCVLNSPLHTWHVDLEVTLKTGEIFRIYLSEPDFTDKETLEFLKREINEVLAMLTPYGGYYDLPEVRDIVCEQLKIPETAFDEGISHLLDLNPSPLTTGLRYESISARRKPLVRPGEPLQLYNLIRRVS